MLLQLFAKNCPKLPPSFFCHKDGFFRKPTRISLVLMNSFLKSPRPSLPLKRAPPLSPSPFPLRGQGMCQPPYSVLKPLRYMVGGPSEVFASSRAAVCGMRPHGHESLRGCCLNSFNFWTYETWVNYLCSFAKFINAIAVNLLKQIRMSACIKQAKD